jgi:hypothetical protein
MKPTYTELVSECETLRKDADLAMATAKMLERRVVIAEATLVRVRTLADQWTAEPARSVVTTYASVGSYLCAALANGKVIHQ